jgi:hypothetical protein
MKNKLITDEAYIHNESLPVWIVPVSGWGSESIENAYLRMEAYKQAAESFNINIEFSTRLGTFQSYKRTPAVGKQIEEHNDHTFAVYTEILGKDWQRRFIDEVHKQIKEN